MEPLGASDFGLGKDFPYTLAFRCGGTDDLYGLLTNVPIQFVAHALDIAGETLN